MSGSHFDALAAGIRAEAADGIQWDGLRKVCASCGTLTLETHDGYCNRCNGLPSPDTSERRAKSIHRGYRDAAELLRRLAGDPGINSTFRGILLEEAAILDRRSS